MLTLSYPWGVSNNESPLGSLIAILDRLRSLLLHLTEDSKGISMLRTQEKKSFTICFSIIDVGLPRNNLVVAKWTHVGTYSTANKSLSQIGRDRRGDGSVRRRKGKHDKRAMCYKATRRDVMRVSILVK